MTPSRKRREALFYLTLKALTATPSQRPVAAVESELHVLATHEVEHGEAGFVIREPESAAELL
jgi:hypothetical protein